MAKSKQATAETPLTREQIVNWYIADVLEGNEPKNVYLFSKNHGITESDFYNFFNGFDGIENHFFELIFDKTLETLIKSKQYSAYSAKEKLLGFYYTFFGNLTTNRSFIMYLLKPEKLESLRKLKGLHQRFVDYIRTLDIEKLDLKQKDLNKFQNRAIEEAAWIQFLSIMKFWHRDESAAFEKTDIFIEKSVKVGFDLINVNPIKSVADLGKFIYKEFNPVT